MKIPITLQDKFESYCQVCHKGTKKTGKNTLEVTKSWCERVGDVYDKEKKFYNFSKNKECPEKSIALCSGTGESEGYSIDLYDVEDIEKSKAKDAFEKTCNRMDFVYKDLE